MPSASDAAPTPAPGGQALVQARCRLCHKRIGDYVNAVVRGYAIFVRICRHCGTRNEITMAPAGDPVQTESMGDR